MKPVPLIIIILCFAAIGGGAWYYFAQPSTATPNANTQPAITTFDECVAAGFPVQESYPPQCVTDDAQTFVQIIGNELEKQDLITIDAPRPQTTVTSPLTVTGRARGGWYFEGVFPVELIDTHGNLLGSGQAHAQSEWTTDEFVPFTATIDFYQPSDTAGELILRKDNPSGLAENDDLLNVPVHF